MYEGRKRLAAASSTILPQRASNGRLLMLAPAKRPGHVSYEEHWFLHTDLHKINARRMQTVAQTWVQVKFRERLEQRCAEAASDLSNLS